MCDNITMNRFLNLIAPMVTAAGTVLFAGTGFVDFRTDKTGAGWDTGYTTYDATRGRKFSGNGDAMISPIATATATQATIVVSVTRSNNPPPRFRLAIGSNATELKEIAYITNRTVNVFTTNTFSFSAADDIRRLKITLDSNSNSTARAYLVGAGFGSIPDICPAPIRFSEIGLTVWHENFDACSKLFPQTQNTCAWTNSLTLTGWQAFQDGVAPNEIIRNHGALASVGLYAYWTADEHLNSYALGMNVGAKANSAVWGIVFTNDTVRKLINFSLTYTGRQYGFKNKEPQTLAVEWLVTNRLVAIDCLGAWRSEASLTFTTPAANATNLVSGVDSPIETLHSGVLNAAVVHPSELLLLRWHRLRVTNSAAIGIDDIEMKWHRADESTVFIVR